MPDDDALREAFSLAVRNIAAWGDTDIFPLPVENHVLHDRQSPVVELLVAMHHDFDSHVANHGPVNESALALVGYTGFRWATELDPIWNAYLLGIVIAVAGELEGERVPEEREVAFSYRWAPDAEDAGLFRRDAWARFLARSREIAEDHAYVVTCDIADFYSRIYHHRLENALRFATADQTIARHIIRLLRLVSSNKSYGLPVGGPAARMLSELLLDRTDRLLLRERVTFVRFADDYHLFADSRDEAYKALQLLSEKLYRNEGLSLQKAKTRVMDREEFIRSALFLVDDDEARPGAQSLLRLSLRFDPYSPTAEEDHQALREQIERFDITGMLAREMAKSRVNVSLTRRLVRAIQFLEPSIRDAAVLSLMDNLEVLAPLLPTVLRTVRELFDDLGVDAQEAIILRILNLIDTGSYLIGVELNLAYALRVLAARRSEEAEVRLASLYGSEIGAFIKRDIMLIMARWGARDWLSDAKNSYGHMHPWVKRAFVVSSFVLGDEGEHWRRAIRRTQSPFDAQVLAWAAERSRDTGWQVPV